MATKMTNSKETNYKITRIRPPMKRDELDKLANELKSDDDFVNYHLDTISDTNNKYMITIMNDEFKSPKKNSNEERSYGFMKVMEALDFVNDYIDAGKANSKPKEVMRNGYSKRSADKYNMIVEQEEQESKAVGEFTKPTFDDIMNNIYVNVYNGDTYNNKDELLPDELREDVGVIIPGLIENQKEYFEFVQRLKDKGKTGLGRSIYDKYEDYLEATELIETYVKAVYDKYGGVEEYYNAKELGGMFGAYEYMPNIKPRFKKSLRNIKLDRGMNLNELANVKDMGARIREELDEEINQLEVDYDYIEYKKAPPKYKDLPEDLKLFYKTDQYGNNGFTQIKQFKKMEQYANDLIRNGKEQDIEEGYRILDMLDKERIASSEIYMSDFVDILDDTTELGVKEVVNQLDYDKMLSDSNYDIDYVDNNYDTTESYKVFKNYMKEYICGVNGFDMDNPTHKSQIEDLSEYATKYMFNSRFRQMEDEKKQVNSAGDVLYKNNKEITFGPESTRETSRANESKIQTYIRKIAKRTQESLEMINSNADTMGYTAIDAPTMSVRDITNTSYNSTVDSIMNGFELNPKASELVKYMKNSDELSKKIYELSSDKDAEDMFSPRTGLDEFVDLAMETTKPFMTENMLETAIKNKKRGVIE